MTDSRWRRYLGQTVIGRDSLSGHGNKSVPFRQIYQCSSWKLMCQMISNHAAWERNCLRMKINVNFGNTVKDVFYLLPIYILLRNKSEIIYVLIVFMDVRMASLHDCLTTIRGITSYWAGRIFGISHLTMIQYIWGDVLDAFQAHCLWSYFTSN